MHASRALSVFALGALTFTTTAASSSSIPPVPRARRAAVAPTSAMRPAWGKNLPATRRQRKTVNPPLPDAPTWASGQVRGSKVVGKDFFGLFKFEAPPRPEPRWIRFHPQPGETLAQIARRFDVQVSELAEWNRIKNTAQPLRRRRSLKVFANRFPAPRLHTRYWVRNGDTWGSIAKAFGVEETSLRTFNPKKSTRPLRRGDRVLVWADSALPRWGKTAPDAAKHIRVRVPVGATSTGYPHKGRLRRGARMPSSDLYTLKLPQFAFASTSTMAQMQRGIASFRRRTGFDGQVLITSISKRRGGKFDPHRSHQSGRDVDIGLLAFPGFANGEKAHGAIADWGATWTLIREFINSGEVERIFLEYRLQKKLYEAAKATGESDRQLRWLFQYPNGPKRAGGIIRHEPGQVRHFHVRWRCGPSDKRCRGGWRS